MEPARRIPLQSLPPRTVPLSARLHVLFGGTTNQMGWFMIGFGMIFVHAFAFRADITYFLFDLLETETANATVTGVETTHASEGGDTDSSQIHAVDYQYVARGIAYSGRSYGTGFFPTDGDRVTVEYLSLDPAFSRIQGLRREVFGAGAAMAIIFPLIGAGFVASGLLEGIKGNRLLTQGRWAMGTLKATEPTGASINRRPVLKLTFEFTPQEGGVFHAVTKTHQPEALEDESQEPVLYDPLDPGCAVMADGLPGSLRLDQAGNVLAANPWRTLSVLAIPALTVIGNGAYLLLAWVR